MPNQNRHVYTCLAAPDELQKYGLTVVIARNDLRDQFVAAFANGHAASIQCNQLNGFAEQDEPQTTIEEDELAEANRLATEREKEQTLVQKIAAAQAASVTKS